MKHTITLIPGDGIGPEVSHAVQQILGTAGVDILWEEIPARAEIERRGQDFMQAGVLESIHKNRVALKGPLATASVGGPPSINVGLRKALDLYANVRPVKNLEGVQARYLDVDIVLIRENTEDLYAGLEHIVVPGVVESLKIITEKASTRIARYAFEYAKHNGRRKVTSVHKANIMKLSDGLFLDCCRKVSRDYAGIAYEEVIVDNMCLQLVRNPERFDVLLMENLYGDILSDLCAGLVGGLGVVPGGNFGERVAVFEAVHGTAPDIAGKGLANPTALMMSAVLMLRFLELKEAAEHFERALLRVYAEGKARTQDLGGSTSCRDFTDAVIAAL